MKICRNNLIQCAKICLILLCVAICLSAQKISLGKNELQSFERSIDEGRIDEVEKNLFNYVVANPKDAVGFSLLAKLRLKQDRPNEARSLSQKALMLDPNLLSAKLNLALVSIQLGEIEQAQLLLNGISENEITSNTIRLNLSQTFALAGDCAKALITVDKLPLRIKNRDALPLRGVCYLETGDKKSFDSLIPIAKALAKLDPAVAVKFAELLNKAGKPKEASDLLRSIVTTAPKNILALLLLARSEIYLKDFANAKHHLDRAEKLRPDSAEMLFVKSLLEREMGNAVQSLDLLEKALAASPNDVEILAQFVLTTMRTNQAGRAVRAAENLLNRQPDNLEFLYLYGAASLQNNNLEAAETSLRKFTESRPQDARGCLALGLTFAAQPDKLHEVRQQMHPIGGCRRRRSHDGCDESDRGAQAQCAVPQRALAPGLAHHDATSTHSHTLGSHELRSSARSPIGFTPAPAASAWPTRAWRHLTRSGMPPAEIPAISGTSPNCSRSAM